MRIFLLGGTGQVGREMQRARLPQNWAIIAPGRAQVDMADAEALFEAVLTAKPDMIVNAGAYTAVDRAETDIDTAYRVNRDAPAALARAASRLNAPFVHISTDFVFRGDKTTPYKETDLVDPINVYGRSKAEGERAVMELCKRAAIVRTSWVYSPFGTNFVKTMRHLAKSRREVGVVSDQCGRPTAARDVAYACTELQSALLDRDKSAEGLFHYAGGGDATWADLAQAVFDELASQGERPVRVRRLTTAEYPTAAARPVNSRLDTSKIEARGVMMPPWRDSVASCVAELRRQTER